VHAALDRQPPLPHAPSGGDGIQSTSYETADELLRLDRGPDRALLALCLDFLGRGDGTTSTNEELAIWLSSSRLEPAEVSATTYSTRLTNARNTYAYLPAEEKCVDDSSIGLEAIIEYLVRRAIVTDESYSLLFDVPPAVQSVATTAQASSDQTTGPVTQAVRTRRGRG
jgi:hypothetical protein